MTDKVKIFKSIFEGLDSAYGQTIKTDQFDERGKHKTKSYTVGQVLFQLTKKINVNGDALI